MARCTRCNKTVDYPVVSKVNTPGLFCTQRCLDTTAAYGCIAASQKQQREFIAKQCCLTPEDKGERADDAIMLVQRMIKVAQDHWKAPPEFVYEDATKRERLRELEDDYYQWSSSDRFSQGLER